MAHRQGVRKRLYECQLALEMILQFAREQPRDPNLTVIISLAERALKITKIKPEKKNATDD